MRKYLIALIMFFSVTAFMGRAEAVRLLDDSFTTVTHIDRVKTTATVHTDDGGYIHLARNRSPSALNVYGDRYAVVTKDGVDVYRYDTDTNKIKYEASLSPPPLISARGVVLNEDNSMWVLTKDELLKFEHSGSMINNPFLSVSGLSNVIAMIAHPVDDHVIVLTEEDGKGKINWYSNADGELAYVPSMSHSLSYSARSVSMIPGTLDYVVISDDAAYYYSYGTFNPLLSLTGKENLVAVSAQDDEIGYLLLNDKSTEYIAYTGEGMSTASILSQGSVDKSLAVSLNPGSYDRAILTENGEIQYYSWTGTGFKRNSAMEITGIELMSLFVNPGWYYSLTLDAPTGYDEARITVDEEIPVGTDIKYSVSNDNGSTWHDIEPDLWLEFPAEGNKFIVRAELSTNDESITPMLYSLALDVTKFSIFDFEVINITAITPGVSYSDRPLRLKAGSEVIYRVQTTGFGEEVIGTFTPGNFTHLIKLDEIPPAPHTDDDSWDMWLGRYVVPIRDHDNNKIAQGTPITAVITVYRNSGTDWRELDFGGLPFGIVEGDSTLDNLEVILIQ